MKNILVIQTSPNMKGVNGSLSNMLLDKVLSGISTGNNLTIHRLDDEKYFHNCISADNFKDYFDEESDRLIKELNDADVVIFSTPTINFGIPSLLKNYFDRVLQAGKTFKFKYDKGKGMSVGLLPEDKKAVILNTQGSPSDWYEFTSTSSSIEGILKFIGITNINKLEIFGTKTQDFINLKYDEILNNNLAKIQDIINWINK